MAFGPVENFRNFLSSRPPLVLFVVCVGMIAIAFISYAYYIKYNDVYNPDIQEKLDKFAKTVTDLNLCTKLSNESWVLTPNAQPANVTLEDIFMHYNYCNDSRKKEKYNTISFPVTVSVSFLKKKDLFPRPITDFVSSFPASLVGVSGDNENKSLAMEMVPKEPVALKCSNEVCLVEYEMCTTVIAPAGVLPNTRQPYLNECMLQKDNSSRAFIAWLDVSAPPGENDHSLAECTSSILLKAERIKEKLTVLLTLEKRSEVNMHLMHSSYFLFVVVLTILLFGILTGGGERKHARSQGNHYSMMGSIAP